jgi:hypothetical protein
MEKVIATIIWDVYGIYIVDFLPDAKSYNSEYFVENILNRLYWMKADIWGKSDVKKFCYILIIQEFTIRK